MRSALPYLICCFTCFNNAVHSQNTSPVAQSLERDFKNGILYAHFVPEKTRYLNASSIAVTSVNLVGDCSQACLQTPSCFSFNLASSPDVDGKRVCELLPTDKFNSSDRLQVSEHFDHYSIKTFCDTAPCRNGGRCVAKYEEDNFTCLCAPGYEGRHCEKDINECLTSACQNGASCVDQVNSYSCNCVPGFTGVYCQNDMDECSNSPCQNGASCEDQVNGYVCHCDSGYSGDHCEIIASSGQWEHHTPYICGSSRVFIRETTTVDECKNLCGNSCIAVEWWESGSRSCYKCPDTSNKRKYTNTNDAAYPPHLYIKI